LDEEACPDCLTSPKDCIPDDPVCFIEGQCQGIVDIIKTSTSAEECLQLCDSTFGCRWFTFFSTASECILLKSCSTVDESCEACLSGERRCVEVTSTTLLTPTESTPESTESTTESTESTPESTYTTPESTYTTPESTYTTPESTYTTHQKVLIQHQ
jgi:hypothetical protein